MEDSTKLSGHPFPFKATKHLLMMDKANGLEGAVTSLVGHDPDGNDGCKASSLDVLSVNFF